MTATEIEKTLSSGTACVVDIWASWCAPCRQMDPLLRKVATDFTDQVTLLKLNADELPDLVGKLGVRSIPTVIGFSGGQETGRRTGLQREGDIREFFTATLENRPAAGVKQTDRFWRIAVSILLLIFAKRTGYPAVAYAGAVLFFFWAIHDRCPIWNAVKQLWARNP